MRWCAELAFTSPSYGHQSTALLRTLLGMSNCHLSSGIWHLDPTCTRTFWGTVIPSAFVFVLCVATIPVPTWLSNLLRPVKGQFVPFLTLQEAEALDATAAAAESKTAFGDTGQDPHDKQVEPGHLWKSLLLSWFALVETLVWFGVASFTLVQDGWDSVYVASSFVLALTWLFATVRPIIRPISTPPYGLFTLYLIYTVFELVSLGAFVYNHHAYNTPFPPPLALAPHILNLCILLILIVIVLSMPLAIPSSRVEKAKIVSRCDEPPLQCINIPEWFREYPFLRKTIRRFGVGSRSRGCGR